MRVVIILSLIFFSISISAQSMRYFEFTTQCGHGNWQDTSFIAATDDQTVIDSVLSDLSKPYEARRFISGSIDHGNGGYNHNAGHWFLWHFTPGQWELAEMAIEVCDGCPYSDVDADTAYWVSNIGSYCPWSSKVAREVSMPVDVKGPDTNFRVLIYPNPADDMIILQASEEGHFTIHIYDQTGRLLMQINEEQSRIVDLSPLGEGLYLLKFYSQNNYLTESLLICR
jgi:hypothetical protein